MTKHLLCFLILILVGLMNQGYAQSNYEFRYQNNVKISVDQKTLENPWSGGLNSAGFSKIDLDLDGTEDLFVFDRTQNKVFTYLARQVNSKWQWQYQPEYEALFPSDLLLTDWVLLRDYNQDGKKDIFTKTNLGIKVFNNITSLTGPLRFALAEDYIRFNNGINLQVSSNDLPSLTDMDNDGDLDILCFDFSSGHTIQLYKNTRVEDKLHPDSLRFRLEDSRWGKITRCEDECGHIAINSACRTTGTKHSQATTLLAVDLDNDQDKDLLINTGCTQLMKITNQGTPTKAVMSSADLQQVFPANTTPADFPYLLAAYYEDVTFDGIPDLLVSPFLTVNSGLQNTRQSVWLYQNKAASASAIPVFSFIQTDFLQNNMLDLGEDSAPTFADIDADGDLDMLVGDYASLRDGNFVGGISLYRNTGTATQPQFKFETNDYAGLSSLELDGIKPRFADVNGDGRLDLIFSTIIGTATGTNKYILNEATVGKPFLFDVTAVQSLPIGTNVEDTALFYDLDKDGDQDVLISTSFPLSETGGPLLFYRNTGTKTKPVYTLANEMFGKIKFSEQDFIRPIYPIIADLNNDNSPELLTADNNGRIRIYVGFMDNLNGAFQEDSAIVANSLTNKATNSRLGLHLILAAADLNNDQKPELIAGTAGGGLYYLTQGQNVTGIKEAENYRTAISVFPNPANNQVTIISPEKVTVALFNSAGKKVLVTDVFKREHQINVAGLAAGLYYVQAQTPQGLTAGYKLLIKK